jgi:NitT/TauT family transport system ATP-binding protein
MVRISIRDLSKTFTQGPREVPAVSHVSFDIRDKEFVALVGPSGCGKSTILNMIGALVAPSGGEIVVDGERVGGAPPPKVGYVFQKDTVFPWRTVERNIALGLEYRGIPAA